MNDSKTEYYYSCTIGERDTILKIFDLLSIEIVDEQIGKYGTEFLVKAHEGFQYIVNRIFNEYQDYTV